MRVAVVGHVEWVEFAQVEHVPRPGEIVRARATWQEPAGGGAVAAVQLSKLAGGATLFTALGDDDLGHRAAEGLRELGLRVETVFRGGPQRRCFVYLDDRGERTITIIGPRMGPWGGDPLPWEELDGADGVYFTAGDREALRRARRARVVVATSRVLPELARAKVRLDALVGSSRDADERYTPGALDPPPPLVVSTRGAEGGLYAVDGGPERRYPPAPLPGPVRDAYGCGDSFAAGLTFGLAAGNGALDALAVAARCGAACLTGRGPYEGQLRSPEGPR